MSPISLCGNPQKGVNSGHDRWTWFLILAFNLQPLQEVAIGRAWGNTGVEVVQTDC